MSKQINAIYKQLTWTETEVKTSKTLPVKFVTAVQERTLTGDMEGFGVATYTMTYFGPEVNGCQQAAAYAGQMFFDGTILGKKGTVSINTKGVYDKGDIVAQWLIASDTATGELVGIKGQGGYSVKNMTCDSPCECTLNIEMP